MADVEMNKGVQILLERMSSNPDEFIPDLGDSYPIKWQWILTQLSIRVDEDNREMLPYLTDAEVTALWTKLQILRGDLFTKRIMDTLLRDAHEPESDYKRGLPTTIAPPPTTAELSLLSRQVTGESPKGLF